MVQLAVQLAVLVMFTSYIPYDPVLGVGVYYGATVVEAQFCGGEEVNVVGGGNSAGQAAVFLA